MFFKNCLFGYFRKVDEAKEKNNNIVKLQIIMSLLIKNKGNKVIEYCFNKDFFITVLSMLNMCQQSAVDSTMSTQVKKKKKILKIQAESSWLRYPWKLSIQPLLCHIGSMLLYPEQWGASEVVSTFVTIFL